MHSLQNEVIAALGYDAQVVVGMRHGVTTDRGTSHPFPYVWYSDLVAATWNMCGEEETARFGRRRVVEAHIVVMEEPRLVRMKLSSSGDIYSAAMWTLRKKTGLVWPLTPRAVSEEATLRRCYGFLLRGGVSHQGPLDIKAIQETSGVKLSELAPLRQWELVERALISEPRSFGDDSIYRTYIDFC